MSLKEETFEIPVDLVKKSPGFSLDIGASTGKLIYRSKKEFKAGKPIGDTKNNKGTVHMVTFNQNDVDTAINMVKECCDVTWKEGDPPIKTTGVGCNLHKAKLEQGLGVKLENHDEFLCLAKAFVALKDSGDKDLFVQLPKEAEEEMQRIVGFIKMTRSAWSGEKMKFSPVRENLAMTTATEIKLPCLMAVCGSVCAMIKVDEDGSYRFMEGQITGGKFFLGFSTILLGKKPFNEMMEEVLAADGRTCDYRMSEILSKDQHAQQKPAETMETTPEDEETTTETKEPKAEAKETASVHEPRKRKESEKTLYSVIDKLPGADSMRFFPMSRVLDLPAEQVKKSDAAFSMLETICELIVQSVSLATAVNGLNQVYFIGNFANIPQVRYWLTKLMLVKMAMMPVPVVDFQFPKLGGHLGSLGAFIM